MLENVLMLAQKALVIVAMVVSAITFYPRTALNKIENLFRKQEYAQEYKIPSIESGPFVKIREEEKIAEIIDIPEENKSEQTEMPPLQTVPKSTPPPAKTIPSSLPPQTPKVTLPEASPAPLGLGVSASSTTELIGTVVNILCLADTNSKLNSTTGSGVIIDKKGVILTNAHIAQYFLLPREVACVIRTGSPARATYRAELIYLPPKWIEKNYTNITLEEPTGTGEDDYALLQITGNVSDTTLLPEEFPSIQFDEKWLPISKDQIFLAGYPASFLGGAIITKELYAASTFAPIKELFTFKDQSVDLFSLEGNILAQRGASGGAAVDGEGRMVGLIVTTTNEATTAERQVRAISIGHINRSLTEYLGVGLRTFLETDMAKIKAEFQTTVAPRLAKILLTQSLEP